ncbi:MAG: hypothetical protein N2554_09340 [Fimbriimonadales bacterium]|nr:hypothetical protein [Fimbriimonadales bacterium]
MAWRQAQGAWQNAKGTQYETIIQQMLAAYLQERGLVNKQEPQNIELQDGRVVISLFLSAGETA